MIEIALVLLAAAALVAAGAMVGTVETSQRHPLPSAQEWQPRPATTHGMRYYYGPIWTTYTGSVGMDQPEPWTGSRQAAG